MSSNNDEPALPRPKSRAVKPQGVPHPGSSSELPVPAARKRKAAAPAVDGSRFEQTIANHGDTQSGHGTDPDLGRYEVVHLIAAGGMGEVWLAKDRRFRNRFVALKRLKKEFRSDEMMTSRFEAEGEALARLVHIHTIRVFDIGVDGDGPFISMEFVAGPDRSLQSGWPGSLPPKPLNLDEHVTQNGCYSSENAVSVVRKIGRAVGEAHALEIVHRDLKPANVLLDGNLEPKLIDFGLARDVGPTDTQHTLAGSQLLTLGYGAPEQEIDASQADHRADIYALGGILWFLISGQNPRFYRDSEVPPELRTVIARCMERDRDLRYQSVAELDAALAQVSKVAASTPDSASVLRPVNSNGDLAVELMQIATALDGPRTTGTCPMCNHVHSPAPTSQKVRQYCAGCGANLWLKCTKCNSKSSAFSLRSTPAIPLWDRYCNRCGDDLLGPAVQQLRQLNSELTLARSTDPGKIDVVRGQAEKITECLKQFSQTYGTEFEAGRIGEIVKAVHEEIKTMHSTIKSRQCSNDEQLWNQACESNSADAYNGYLKQYPSGQFASQALHRVTVFDLAASVRKRLKEKEYVNLTRDVKQLIQWSPAVAKEWPDAKLWSLATRDGSAEACWAYLEVYPDGQAYSKATEFLSPELRQKLLRDMKNNGLRETYLKYRSETEKGEDEARAFQCTVLTSTLLGIAFALCAGLVSLSSPQFFWVAVTMLPAGLVIGLALSFFSARYAKYGPLPRLYYLLPESATRNAFLKSAASP